MEIRMHSVSIPTSDDVETYLEECELDAIDLLGDVMALRCFLKRAPSPLDDFDCAMEMYLGRITSYIEQHASDVRTNASLVIRAYQKSQHQGEIGE